MTICKPETGEPMRQSKAFKDDLARHPEAVRSRPPQLPDVEADELAAAIGAITATGHPIAILPGDSRGR